MIVLMAGLPGTGKSTLARNLSDHTQCAVLGKDEIRAAIFSAIDIEYSVEQDDFVMGIMLDAARFLCMRSPIRTVLLDGRTFSKTYQIDRALNLADEIGQQWKIIECVCSDETARRRLNKVDHGNENAQENEHPAKNRSFDLYLAVKAGFEPIARPKMVIDTEKPFEQCVSQALAYLSPS